MFKVNNESTRTTSFSSVFILDFEQSLLNFWRDFLRNRQQGVLLNEEFSST